MTMTRRGWLAGCSAAIVALAACGKADAKGKFAYTLTDAEWRKQLSPAAYKTLRKEGTETPYTSPLNKEKRKGVYSCAGCKLAVFSSATKYDSGTGWPSFWAPIKGGVGQSTDYLLGYPRTEVHCARCGGHLGHVFDDGPKPTGKRYCMNGVAMTFAVT